MARIVLAMSGGVDSSVAAGLLRREGHQVVGVFMRHGITEPTACATAANSTSTPVQHGQTSLASGSQATATLPIVQRADHKQGCCTASDAEDARRAADRFDIPFYALDMTEDFGRIIDYFVAEYTAARTPNPCVMCNNWLKFGKLFEYADSVGAEFVATGHYARVQSSGFETQEGGMAETQLLRGLDADKDQSYVLFGVARKYLSRMRLPVGNFRKPQIRELARELGLRVADKKDSQEICFVTSGHHGEFVRGRRDSSGVRVQDSEFQAHHIGGEIVLTDGTVVGEHDGIESFTIGQRKGLGVAMGEPYYVTRIEAETRRVVIGRHEELARRGLTFDRANWLVEALAAPMRCEVQIRYNSAAKPALLTPLSNDRFHVQFDIPRHGVAPGQAAVVYDGERVLGGGWIE
ncbi:MAG: tRNA 2-thiouridine(34) synthase MnmA [Pirellulales bacterium]|nr:tRNA 2-thiouridine(34) synthase MnmA [Pirellulales bacterium]